MADLQHSAERLSGGGDARKVKRVIVVERDADRRGLLGKELSREHFAVQGFSDEQVLLDSPDVLQHADIIVLGPSRSIASVLSLSVRLNNAGIRVPIVNLADLRRLVGEGRSNEAADRVGPGLQIEDMLRDLKQLAEGIAQQAGRRFGDIVSGRLVLRPDGTTRWNDIEVPLTSGELEIVKLLVRNFGQFISYDAIYGLRHVWPDAAAADEHQRRTSVRLAIRRTRKKLRNCDPTFAEIQNYRAFGYRWGRPVRTAAFAGKVINWPRKR